MKIHVASKNNVKIEAVSETIIQYPMLFVGSRVTGVKVRSNVPEQPKTLEETVQGAVNRAKAAFPGSDFSFGIESGLMHVPCTKTGKMDFCACAIYDGKEIHLGLSCAFEYPKKVTQMIHLPGMNASKAFYELGLTRKKRIGSEEGAIGILTNGRLTRKDYTKQSIMMALIHLENSSLY